ncbi:MAG: LamG domain-containing protein [Chitinophagaceae bacterium]|nr:LamG domain-containing protein [Chitinophagaceae bacterium]
MKLNNIKACLVAGGWITLSLTACTKSETDDTFRAGDPPAIAGGYTNSSEVAPGDLVAYFPFDGTIDDAKGSVTGGVQHGAVSFTEGRKGQAYQGAADAFISYSNPGSIAGLTSFTVAFWIKTEKHLDGAQGVFMLSRQDGAFWGNLFATIEGTRSSDNKMQMKFHFEKPSVQNAEHWIAPGDKYWPDDMYGAWRHIAYTYDEATSKVTRYISGNIAALPDNPAPGGDGDIVDQTATGDPGKAGSVPLGALAFKDAKDFVIGGFQNHLGMPYNGLESWMINYTGSLDEFRVYKKALSATEVAALYKLERQSR